MRIPQVQCREPTKGQLWKKTRMLCWSIFLLVYEGEYSAEKRRMGVGGPFIAPCNRSVGFSSSSSYCCCCCWLCFVPEEIWQRCVRPPPGKIQAINPGLEPGERENYKGKVCRHQKYPIFIHSWRGNGRGVGQKCTKAPGCSTAGLVNSKLFRNRMI